MKDSNIKSKKSSSDSENPVKNIIPEMPKDKRTKAYKEWIEKYGEQSSDSTNIPEMPKDKRTKAYKDWVKQYGNVISNVEKSVKKTNEIKKVKTKINKTKLIDLVNSFVEFINSEEWFHKRKEIEDLKTKINLSLKKSDSDSEESKELKSTFFQTLKNYSHKKRKHFNELSSNQKENLHKREELIQKIKDLIVVDENSNKLYSKFKLLKEEWHNVGQVPITDRNNIWETYRHHVSKFYDFLHLNRDLRDLDYKHNYEEKLKIIERAEKLDKVDDIIKASRDLNDLHRLWKNELGPVARQYSNELWSRFQKASHKIHSKRQDFQKEISNVQEVNFEKKQNVIAKMRDLTTSNAKTHSDWQNKIKDFEKLKVEFQNIKNLHRNKNKKSWDDFRIATKAFNTNKNDFYKNQKKELKKSIDLKKGLIQEVKNILEKNPPENCQIHFNIESAMGGCNAPETAPWLEKSMQIASENYFNKPSLYMGTGGSIPFMGMLVEKFPKAQFLVTGLLGPNSNAHGPNEFLDIDTGKKLTGCVAQVILDHFINITA